MTHLILYTDPGSGMMLLQVIFAFAASGLFYCRKYFYKIFKAGKTVDGVENGGNIDPDKHRSDR